MPNKTSNHNNASFLEDREIIQILEKFQPIPSQSFHHRMSKAPWAQPYRIPRFALQVAVLVTAIFIFVLINPTDIPPLSSTDTPTSTSTITKTDDSHLPQSTEIPTTENNIYFEPTRTPSK